MSVTINGRPILTLELTESRVGTWFARFEADADELDVNDEAPAGAVVLDVEGETFAGALVNSEIEADSRWRGIVVGGAGRLTTELEARHFFTPSVQNIVTAWTRLTGETVDPGVEASVLSHRFARWSWVKGPAYTVLTELAAALGVDWKILRNGNLWLGTPSWSEVETTQELIEEELAAEENRVTIAYDNDGEDEPPDAQPGQTLDGRQIHEAKLWVDSGWNMRHDLYFGQEADTDRLAPARAQEALRQLWPCQFVLQRGDNTMDLLQDDPAIRGAGGMQHVPLQFGLPGVRIKAAGRSRGLMGWAGGDPARPIAGLWDWGTPVDEMSVEVQKELRLGADDADDGVVVDSKLQSALLDALDIAILAALDGDGGAAALGALKTALSTAPPTGEWDVAAAKVKAR